MSNGPVTNLFHEPIRCVDLTFGVSYEDDIAQVRSVKPVDMLEIRRLTEHLNALGSVEPERSVAWAGL